ncbi:MAG: Xaa-Pro peptidase family protein [Treponema sp.]|jgi:Xaa-Pro aminopeptidase|nr:Xaa-Pro peptidase family protein [Treponema sp.]
MGSARKIIPRSEYDKRVEKIQTAMREKDIDVYIVHSCECESANVRYLTNFWAVFDFVGVLIPREGKPILLTGGPESYEYAKQFAQIDDIRVHPMYVETSAPEWDKPTDPYNYSKIFDEFRSRFPLKKIAVGNTNTIPHQIMKDIMAGSGDAEIVNGDQLIMKIRWIKSDNELALLREAYRITDEAVRSAVEIIKPGVREWEIEAAWRAKAYQMGAEGTGYPIWVTSGPYMYQSLSKSTDRVVEKDSVIQLSLGAKYQGYCGNLCRPVLTGKIDQKRSDMIKTARECLEETAAVMGPGVPFAKVYDIFQARLEKAGYKGLNLYGPAHGTGLQECEGPWVDNRGTLIMEPNMVFNIDVWIADHEFGIRFEDGVIVTGGGLERLTALPAEAIQR